jgi:hypothetical protein
MVSLATADAWDVFSQLVTICSRISKLSHIQLTGNCFLSSSNRYRQRRARYQVFINHFDSTWRSEPWSAQYGTDSHGCKCDIARGLDRGRRWTSFRTSFMDLYVLPRRPGTFRVSPMTLRSTQTTSNRFSLTSLTSDKSVTHLTNEQASPDGEPSSKQVGAPPGAAIVWHESCVVWHPGVTKFYIDSELVHSIDKNSPNTPAFFFVWSSWFDAEENAAWGVHDHKLKTRNWRWVWGNARTEEKS